MTPDNIVRGTTADWTVSAPDYPASDGWVIEYTILNSQEQHDFSTTNVSGVHSISIDASATGEYGAGEYFYQAVAKKDALIYPVETGYMTVKPGFKELTSGYDARPHCKKVLDAIEAMLEGKATRDQARYIIGSRRLDRYTFEELLVFRDRYKAEWKAWLTAEKLKQGLGGGRNILVRF